MSVWQWVAFLLVWFVVVAVYWAVLYAAGKREEQLRAANKNAKP